MLPSNYTGASPVKNKPERMNSMGDFPLPGSTSFRSSAAQFHTSVGSKYPLTLPSLNANPKMASTTGYVNGYPVSPPSQVPAMSSQSQSSQGAAAQSSQSQGLESPPKGVAAAAPPAANDRKPLYEKTVITEKGDIKNLPQSMLTNSYGLAAFFVGLKASATQIQSCPDVLGAQVLEEMNWVFKKDATAGEKAYKSFTGPLAAPAEPASFSMDDGPPPCPEYLVTHRMIFDTPPQDMNYIRRTWALKFDKFGDDLLFYVFYMFTRDILQLVAASHLYRKGWRYHMLAQVWVQRVDNATYVKDSSNPVFEKGIYKYFDYHSWKIVQREINLDTSKMEGPPKVPEEFFVASSACPKT